jgi:hypothetical protein
MVLHQALVLLVLAAASLAAGLRLPRPWRSAGGVVITQHLDLARVVMRGRVSHTHKLLR